MSNACPTDFGPNQRLSNGSPTRLQPGSNAVQPVSRQPPIPPIGLNAPLWGGALALKAIARRLRNLAPDHRNPHAFHERKSDLVAELLTLARSIEARAP